MKRVIIRCQCGSVVLSVLVNDGKEKMTVEEFSGECLFHYKGDYTKGDKDERPKRKDS